METELHHRGGLALRVVLLTALLLVAAAALPGLSRAQAACTITWDGQLGDNWFAFQPNGPGTGDDVYNWSPERYPDQNDDVCFPNGSVASTDLETQNTPTMRSFTISAGATVSVTDVQMIVYEDSTNAGTLNLSGAVPVTVNDGIPADGETLLNTGTIHWTAGGPNGLRALLGNLTNQGTIDVDHPEASIQAASPGAPAAATQLNQGTIDISPGNNLRVLSANLTNGTGGVITGGGSVSMSGVRFEPASNSQIVAPTDVNMTNSVLAGAPGSAATGNIDVYGAFSGGGPSVLEGTVPAGIVVDVEPGVTLQSPAVTTTVNAGRININGAGAQLQVLPNDVGPNSTSKLTNTGTIEFISGGAAGLRTITGDLVNEGSLLVNHPEASFQFPGGSSSVPVLTNAGDLVVSSGNVLRVLSATLVNAAGGTISGNGTINNSSAVENTGGTVAPGASPGILTITGDYSQGPAGTLAVEISGAAPGTGHDQLVVGGTAALGGTLSIDTDGFSPAAGQQFKVIDAPSPPATSITGQFASVVPTGGRTYAVAYNPTDVTLSANAAPPPPDSDGDGVPDASDQCPAKAGPASNAGCPVVQPNGECDEAKAKLRKAKAKLRKLKKQDAPAKKIKQARKRLKKAKKQVEEACA